MSWFQHNVMFLINPRTRYSGYGLRVVDRSRPRYSGGGKSNFTNLVMSASLTPVSDNPDTGSASLTDPGPDTRATGKPNSTFSVLSAAPWTSPGPENREAVLTQSNSGPDIREAVLTIPTSSVLVSADPCIETSSAIYIYPFYS